MYIDRIPEYNPLPVPPATETPRAHFPFAFEILIVSLKLLVKPFMSQMCGLKIHDDRPDIIILTEKEIYDYVSPDIFENGEKADQYIKTVLAPALADGGKLLGGAKGILEED